MSRGIRIAWDHAWMAANWKSHTDDDIARMMDINIEAVKRYRIRRGWKRDAQRYNGGPRSAKAIQAAIDQAMIKGIELCIGRTLVVNRYQMRVVARMNVGGRELCSEAKLLAGISALPRMLSEISEEFARMKRRMT